MLIKAGVLKPLSMLVNLSSLVGARNFIEVIDIRIEVIDIS